MIEINLIVPETKKERLLRQNLEGVKRYQAKYPERVKASVEKAAEYIRRLGDLST